jgi:hypothetical protein
MITDQILDQLGELLKAMRQLVEDEREQRRRHRENEIRRIANRAGFHVRGDGYEGEIYGYWLVGVRGGRRGQKLWIGHISDIPNVLNETAPAYNRNVLGLPGSYRKLQEVFLTVATSEQGEKCQEPRKGATQVIATETPAVDPMCEFYEMVGRDMSNESQPAGRDGRAYIEELKRRQLARQ